MFNSEEFLYRLQTQAFAEIPFPMPRAEIAQIVEGPFFSFLREPPEIRALLKEHKCNTTIRGGEVGLIDRREEQKRDHKVFFHYNEFAEDHYIDVIEKYDAIKALFQAIRPLYAASIKTFRSVFKAFEADFPGITESFLPRGAHPHVYLRILGYMGVGSLTKDHVDQSGATLALAESQEGLYIGWDPEHITNVVHTDRQAVFMPGLTFPEETSELYPPAWHGASIDGRAKYLMQEQHTLDQLVTRWAVVAFLHGSKARWAESAETHAPHPAAVRRAKELSAGWLPKGQLQLRFA